MTELGCKPRYAEDRAFRIRAKSLVGLAFLPDANAPGVFEELECLFAADEVEILSYFEATYVGKKSGPRGDRRAATSPPPLRNAHDRMDHGRTRANYGVESSRSMNSNFLLQAARPSVTKFMDALRAKQRASNLGMGNIARGESIKEKTSKRKEISD